MTDDAFERRARRFEEAIMFLVGMAATPWDVFSSNPEKYASTERFLQIAVEILDDLGAHLVARFGDASIENYRDVAIALGRRGVVDPELELREGL